MVDALFEILEDLPGNLPPIFLLGLGILLALRILAGLLDWWRIADYVRRRGGALISCWWVPFGPGWLGERRERIYRVRFIDPSGDEHRAYCKTSLFSGVYFTDDRVVGLGTGKYSGPSHAALVQEVAQLRAENRKLREALKQANRRI
jgi:hypothetical protein